MIVRRTISSAETLAACIVTVFLALAVGAGCAQRDGEEPESSRVMDEEKKESDAGSSPSEENLKPDLKTAEKAPQELLDSLCFAFNQDADIFVSCNGKRVDITNSDNIGFFAVPADGSAFVYDAYSREVIREIIFLDEERKNRPARWDQNGFFSTCGTVLGGKIDAFTGEPLNYPPYETVRCSSDRKTIVGSITRLIPRTSKYFLKLEIFQPVKQVLINDKKGYDLRFDISPNGKYVVYESDGKLCVTEPGKAPVCIDLLRDVNASVSVSDSGEVLYVADDLDEFCYYQGSFKASATYKPGYELVDSCAAIYYWKPGMAKPYMLEFLGYLPQWVAPEIADRLIAAIPQVPQLSKPPPPTIVRSEGPPQASFCYAFLREGDITVVCEGKQSRITDYGTMNGFAVAFDGLALVWKGGDPEKKPSEEGAMQETVFLDRNFEMTRIGGHFGEFFPSCGTILEEGAGSSSVAESLDDPPILADAFVHSRCSSDRKTEVEGRLRSPGPTIRLIKPVEKTLLEAAKYDRQIFFDVSPNGKYVGYSSSEGLCVTEPDGTPVCENLPGAGYRLSVSDNGTVLIDVGMAGEGCYSWARGYEYDTGRPGHEAPGLSCGVAYWIPGEEKVTLTDPMGKYPQWITPETAVRLRAWSAHLKKNK